jgi:ketosteroid isomerase-like protein
MSAVDHEAKSGQVKRGNAPEREPGHERTVDEFLSRLKNDLRRSPPGDESVAAAVEAVQRFALEADSEVGAKTASAKGATTCNVCGSPNRPGNRFCANCGVPLMDSPPDLKEIVTERPSQSPPVGEHHYHHHYHHHYFSSANGINQAAPAELRISSGPNSARDFQLRAPSGGSLSRAETAMRKLTHDWALACNGKHLEDLVSLYIPDGLVLRSNIPPVRGTAAIREFFFSILGAGLGDVELEPLRVEVFGEIAYEAGRFNMLVPVAMGKRREERGKYMILAARQAGDWKIIADCWSSDLNLGVTPESSTSSPAAQPARPQRRS